MQITVISAELRFERRGIVKELDSFIKKIIEIGNLSERKSFGDTVYRDEPIITTASRMPTYTPEIFGEMRKIELDSRYYGSSSRVFTAQARLMANYEDDFDTKVDFYSYFPTYKSMSVPQLRCYFSWRTKVRRGAIERVSLSYAFVYIYELLALVGTDGPADAFCKLKDFSDKFGEFEPAVTRYINRWAEDFVVYYALSPSLLEGRPLYDNALCLDVLNNPKDDAELFCALRKLSTYNVSNSKLYKKYPDITSKVMCGVWRDFSEYCKKRGQRPLTERLFGTFYSYPFRIFDSAVFCDENRREDTVNKVCDSLIYRRVGGAWFIKSYAYGDKPSKQLGAILKYTDSLTRVSFGMPPLNVNGTKVLNGIITDVIDEVLSEEKEKERKVSEVKIDLSALDGIRKASDRTREALLTDEEREETELPFKSEENIRLDKDMPTVSVAERFDAASKGEKMGEDGTSTVKKENETAKSKSEHGLSDIKTENTNPYSLSETELLIIKAILRKDSADKVAREHGIILSVAIESIDEKLFDTVGDNVIYYDGDEPSAEEYYTDFLKGLFEDEH